MNRALKLWIKPSLLGLVVAGALGYLVIESWLFGAVSEEILVLEAHSRAMEDRVAYERIMSQVEGDIFTLLVAVVVTSWAAAMMWFIRCWRTPVSRVGDVRAQRSRWLWIALLGLLASFFSAGAVLWGSSLLTLVALRPLVYTFVFVVPFFGILYYAAAVLCTHSVYLPAIPWSSWRKWRI